MKTDGINITFRGQPLPLDVQNDIKRLESNGFVCLNIDPEDRDAVLWKNGRVKVRHFLYDKTWNVELDSFVGARKPSLFEAFDYLSHLGVIEIFCRQMWPDDEEEPAPMGETPVEKERCGRLDEQLDEQHEQWLRDHGFEDARPVWFSQGMLDYRHGCFSVESASFKDKNAVYRGKFLNRIVSQWCDSPQEALEALKSEMRASGEDFDKDGVTMDIDAILGKNEEAEVEAVPEKPNEGPVLKCGTYIQGLDSITYDQICEDYRFLEVNGFRMRLAVPGSPVYWRNGSIELELGTDYKWRGHEMRYDIHGEASDDVVKTMNSLLTKLEDLRDKMFSEPLAILDGCLNPRQVE